MLSGSGDSTSFETPGLEIFFKTVLGAQLMGTVGTEFRRLLRFPMWPFEPGDDLLTFRSKFKRQSEPAAGHPSLEKFT